MSDASLTLIALITGTPVRCLISATRSGVSDPCAWKKSGFTPALIASTSASSGSTTSATIFDRPRACVASACATGMDTLRGLGS
jgi:hypothetical protein